MSSASSSFSGVAGATATSIGQVLANALVILPGFEDVVGVVCYICGVAFMLQAVLIVAKNAGQHGGRDGGYGAAIGCAITAVLLISLPTFITMLEMTVFNADINNDTLSYANHVASAGGSQSATVINAYLKWTQIIGVLAIVRGIFLIRSISLGRTNHGYGHAVIFLVSGTLAANIVTSLQVLQSTSGISFGG